MVVCSGLKRQHEKPALVSLGYSECRRVNDIGRRTSQEHVHGKIRVTERGGASWAKGAVTDTRGVRGGEFLVMNPRKKNHFSPSCWAGRSWNSTRRTSICHEVEGCSSSKAGGS